MIVFIVFVVKDKLNFFLNHPNVFLYFPFHLVLLESVYFSFLLEN